jgi:hypothetical protein
VRVARIIAICLFVVLVLGTGGACSFVSGHFHQVTAIRGRVVGRSIGPLQFRWLRQSFSVSDATLNLYEYRSPAKVKDLKKVAVINTDGHGNFDFGAIPNGHYSLAIDVKDSNRLGGWFDVEVTDSVRPTKDIVVDVSPIAPNCVGGHEFIENKKS